MWFKFDVSLRPHPTTLLAIGRLLKIVAHLQRFREDER